MAINRPGFFNAIADERRSCKLCDHILPTDNTNLTNLNMRNHLMTHSEGNRRTKWINNSTGASKKAKKDVFDEPILFTDPIYFEKKMAKYHLPENYQPEEVQLVESRKKKIKKEKKITKEKVVKPKAAIKVNLESTKHFQEGTSAGSLCVFCHTLLQEPSEGCSSSFVYDLHLLQYHPKRLKLNDEKFFHKKSVENFPYLDFRRSNFARLTCSRCGAYFPKFEEFLSHSKSHLSN